MFWYVLFMIVFNASIGYLLQKRAGEVSVLETIGDGLVGYIIGVVAYIVIYPMTWLQFGFWGIYSLIRAALAVYGIYKVTTAWNGRERLDGWKFILFGDIILGHLILKGILWLINLISIAIEKASVGIQKVIAILGRVSNWFSTVYDRIVDDLRNMLNDQGAE